MQTYTVSTKMLPKESSFCDISFMTIFAEVSANEYIIERLLRDIDSFQCSLNAQYGQGTN